MNAIKQAITKVMSKRSRPMMEHTFLMAGDLCKAFYEKYGKEALPVISEVSSRGGEERAKVVEKMIPVKEMNDIGELFKMMDLSMDLGMELIEVSEKTIHLKMPKCVLGIEGTSKELCLAMMSADQKMISRLLGQEVEMNIIKTVAAGDKECEILFSKI